MMRLIQSLFKPPPPRPPPIGHVGVYDERHEKLKKMSYVVAVLFGMLALSVADTTRVTFSLVKTAKELYSGFGTLIVKDGAALHVAGLPLSTDSVAGVGVRTSLARRTGDFLGFYSGLLLTRDAYEHVAQKHPAIARVSFEIAGTDWLVVRESRTDVIGYVNEPPEGMDANVVAIPFHLDAGNTVECNAIGYFAGAPILAGEELLVHYGYDASRDYPVGRPIAQPSDVQPADAALSSEAMRRRTSRYCAPRR
jgi:hypothetical protein